MATAGIIEEVVTPVMKRLGIAEKQVMKLKGSDDKIKKMFEEINMMVENEKAILTTRKEWEGEIKKNFGVVERHIDNILEDKECNTNDALEAILTELKQMVEKKTPMEKPKEEKTPIPNYEEGESSRLSEDSMPFFDKIIETLDPQLRHCLYCLSIFPEKSVIKRRLLVYWWIGLKLVREEKDNTAEQIGGCFFNDLVDKGILIPYKSRKHSTVVDWCKVQPIVHKKLISSAKRKRFILEEINDDSLQVCTIRRNKLDVTAMLNVNQMYLQSDVITKSDIKKMALMQVGQWRCVERHHIEADKTDFLNELVPNLTYLSLQNISGIPELPEPIGNCTSLMILDLRACHNLEKLPPKIKSWKNLTHLDVSMCYLLDHIPKGIGSLGNLEVLKGFVIGSSGNKNRCRLSDISGLSKLRKLTINIGRDSDVSVEESSSLKHLTNLKSLTMTWGIDTEENEPVDQEQNSKTIVPENSRLEQKEKTSIINTPVNISPPEIKEILVDQEQKSKTMVPKNSLLEQKEQTPIINTAVNISRPEIREEIPADQEQNSKTMVPENVLSEQKEETPIITPVNIFPPENMEKLDLRCFPYAEAPKWLAPTELKKLKRLYIRGGNLANFSSSNNRGGAKDEGNEGEGSFSEVETLRLRFLKKNMKEMKRKDLKKIFPRLKSLEWAELDKFNKVKGHIVTVEGMKDYMAEEECSFSSHNSNV